MCWACLNADHLALPTSPLAMTKIAESVVSTSRALLARVDQPSASWSNPLPGRQGPVIISYSFQESNEVPRANNGPTDVSSFWSFSEAQRVNFRLALAEYSKVAGIIFVETEGRAMMQAYGASGSDYGGWGFFPESLPNSSNACDLVIDNTGTFNRGSYGFYTALHEIGHVMGLKHPFSGSITLTDKMDTTANTVMSYTNGGTPTELKSLDIAALRTLYGGPVDTSGWTLRLERGALHASGSSRPDMITGVAFRNNIINGNSGNDTLIGREEFDKLFGGAGDDQLIGLGSGDKLYGGNGHDVLRVEVGGDWGKYDNFDDLYGGAGRDRLYGGQVATVLDGGDGSDTLRGSDDYATLRGGAGDDTLITAGTGALLKGGDGDDTLVQNGRNGRLNGGSGSDTLKGGRDDGTSTNFDAFQDSLQGGGGYDFIYGRSADDCLYAGADGAEMHGGAGNDSLYGGPTGSSLIYGNDGNDLIIAGRGFAVLDGGAGNDTLHGGTVFGNAGKGATLKGGNGDDVLYGVSPADILDGSAGNDILLGGQENDVRGGSGDDVFLFDAAMTGRATIVDFVAAQDRIIVQGLSGTRDFHDISFRTDPNGVIVSITPYAGGSYLELLLKGMDLAEITADMFIGQDGAWLV